MHSCLINIDVAYKVIIYHSYHIMQLCFDTFQWLNCFTQVLSMWLWKRRSLWSWDALQRQTRISELASECSLYHFQGFLQKAQAQAFSFFSKFNYIPVFKKKNHVWDGERAQWISKAPEAQSCGPESIPSSPIKAGVVTHL